MWPTKSLTFRRGPKGCHVSDSPFQDISFCNFWPWDVSNIFVHCCQFEMWNLRTEHLPSRGKSQTVMWCTKYFLSFAFLSFTSDEGLASLKLTATALEYRWYPKRKQSSSNRQFSGAFAVSFREGKYPNFNFQPSGGQMVPLVIFLGLRKWRGLHGYEFASGAWRFEAQGGSLPIWPGDTRCIRTLRSFKQSPYCDKKLFFGVFFFWFFLGGSWWNQGIIFEWPWWLWTRATWFIQDNTMNPHGLLIAYAESTVKPVRGLTGP